MITASLLWSILLAPYAEAAEPLSISPPRDESIVSEAKAVAPTDAHSPKKTLATSKCVAWKSPPTPNFTGTFDMSQSSRSEVSAAVKASLDVTFKQVLAEVGASTDISSSALAAVKTSVTGGSTFEQSLNGTWRWDIKKPGCQPVVFSAKKPSLSFDVATVFRKASVYVDGSSTDQKAAMTTALKGKVADEKLDVAVDALVSAAKQASVTGAGVYEAELTTFYLYAGHFGQPRICPGSSVEVGSLHGKVSVVWDAGAESPQARWQGYDTPIGKDAWVALDDGTLFAKASGVKDGECYKSVDITVAYADTDQ